ncbi:MAG: nitroreductase family protein [Acidimicrobiales bacterium]
MTTDAPQHPVDRGQPGDTLATVADRLQAPLVEVLETQRAVRRLLPDDVDDAIVLRCIELALRAPTGSNGQNWEFVVVRDAEVKAKLAHRYAQAWRLYGAAGERMTAGDESMRKVLAAVAWQVEHFTELPVLVVACLRSTGSSGRVPYVPLPHIANTSYFGSIYPSVQNLLLAAGARPGRLADHPAAVERDVGALDPGPAAVGDAVRRRAPRVAAAGTGRPRRPVGEVVHLDRWGTQPWR